MYNTLFDRLQKPVMIANPCDFSISYANAAAKRFFQLNDSHIDSTKIFSTIDSIFKKELESIITTTVSKGSVVGFPLSFKALKNETIRAEADFNLIDSLDGKQNVLMLFSPIENYSEPHDINKKCYHLLHEIINCIYNTQDINSNINQVLSLIGNCLDVSRVYIFEDDYEKQISSNTYEWCAKGITPQIENLKAVPHEPIKAWLAMLRENGIIEANDISMLPTDVYSILADQGIRSIVAIPLYLGNVMFGYIGFDECRTRRNWIGQEIEVLKALSTLVSAMISRHKAEISLNATHKTLYTVLNNIETPVYVTDLDTCKILFANKKFTEDLNISNAEGKLCWQVTKRSTNGICKGCPREKLTKMDKGETCTWELYNETLNKWYLCADNLIEWIDGRPAHLKLSMDITSRKQYEENLAFSASHDSLTQIYNREAGLMLLENLIKKGQKEYFISTVCFIDIDSLKYVNDNFGHAEGDKLLLSIVAAIKENIRSADVFFRLYADEFLLALPFCSTPNATRIIKNITDKLESLNRSNKHPYHLSFSIGFAEIKPDDKTDVEAILAKADKDMYLNKKSKKTTTVNTSE